MDASWEAGLKWCVTVMLTDDGDICAFLFPDFLHSAEKTNIGLLGLGGENAPLEVTQV